MHMAACMASVRFVKAARAIGIKTDFKIGELSTLAYGTRAFPERGEVELSLRVKEFYFAAYPGKRTSELVGTAQQLYSGILPIDNVWGTTLINGNPECHTGIGLLNAGRIEYSKGEFWLYVEGITEHTVNVLLQVGEERLALGRALGYQLDDGTTARIKRGYLLPGPEPVHVKYNTSPVFSKIKGPSSIDSRYFIEDISNGLVLYSSLGRALRSPHSRLGRHRDARRHPAPARFHGGGDHARQTGVRGHGERATRHGGELRRALRLAIGQGGPK